MSETITLTFSNAQPTLVLLPVSPEEAPAEFAQVLVGPKGVDVDVNQPDGLFTAPTFYYILAST